MRANVTAIRSAGRGFRSQTRTDMLVEQTPGFFEFYDLPTIALKTLPRVARIAS